MHGLCACSAGFSGIDCAHHEPPRRRSATTRRRPHGLAVYVYDLPSDLGLAAFAFNAYRNAGGETIYLAEWHFLEALLGDGSVRVSDPEQADLFFVPTFTAQGVSSNFFCPKGQIELVASHLRAHSPYWQRSSGRDHVFFVTGDKGACGLPPAVGARAIFITHFGLLGPYSAMPRASATTRNLHSSKAVVSEMDSAQWCHAPHKDIVAPPLVPRQPASTEPPTDAFVTRPYKYLLVHAGGIYGPQGVSHSRKSWQSSRYSQGMRQELFERYPRAHPHGIYISERRVPDSTFLESKTCLAPTGEGWGVRLIKSVISGCVPLVAQPWMEQAYARPESSRILPRP